MIIIAKKVNKLELINKFQVFGSVRGGSNAFAGKVRVFFPNLQTFWGGFFVCGVFSCLFGLYLYLAVGKSGGY